MYVERVPNRNSRPTFLIRKSRRAGKKIIKTTILNITALPDEIIEGIRNLLRGGVAVDDPGFVVTKALEFGTSTPHGHVAAVLGTMRKLRLPETIGRKDCQQRRLVLAMIAARVLGFGGSALSIATLYDRIRASTLGAELGVEHCGADDVSEAAAWLLAHKAEIEMRLASRNLTPGPLLLYLIPGAYEAQASVGSAVHEYGSDRGQHHRGDALGLPCTADGCPVGAEFFEAAARDRFTPLAQLRKVRELHAGNRLIVVSRSGVFSGAQLRKADADWILALGDSELRSVVERDDLSASRLDNRGPLVVNSRLYPGERLVVSRDAAEAGHRLRIAKHVWRRLSGPWNRWHGLCATQARPASRCAQGKSWDLGRCKRYSPPWTRTANSAACVKKRQSGAQQPLMACMPSAPACRK